MIDALQKQELDGAEQQIGRGLTRSGVEGKVEKFSIAGDRESQACIERRAVIATFEKTEGPEALSDGFDLRVHPAPIGSLVARGEGRSQTCPYRTIPVG